MIKNEFGGDIQDRQAALISEMKWLSTTALQNQQSDNKLFGHAGSDGYIRGVKSRAAVYRYSHVRMKSDGIVRLAKKLADQQIVRRGMTHELCTSKMQNLGAKTGRERNGHVAVWTRVYADRRTGERRKQQ